MTTLPSELGDASTLAVDHSAFLVGIPPQFFLYGYVLTLWSASPAFGFTAFWLIYAPEVFAIFVNEPAPADAAELAQLLYTILFFKPAGFYIGVVTALLVTVAPGA